MTNSRYKNPKVVVKLADQSKDTDTTIADDTELISATLPVGTYAGEATIFVVSGINADFKWEINKTSGTATSLVSEGALSSSIMADAKNIDSVTGGIATDGTPQIILIKFTILVTAPSVIAFAWAQNTSHAETTIVKQGSSLIIYS